MFHLCLGHPMLYPCLVAPSFPPPPELSSTLSHRSRSSFPASCERSRLIPAMYWHDSLVAARSHPSVLSANNQLLSALTGHTGESLIQADSAQLGVSSSGSYTPQSDLWAIDEQVSWGETFLGVVGPAPDEGHACCSLRRRRGSLWSLASPAPLYLPWSPELTPVDRTVHPTPLRPRPHARLCRLPPAHHGRSALFHPPPTLHGVA